MYNSFHTALSGGSGRIEDACGESPAASYFGLLSLGDFQIIRSLFVHYSFLFVISRSVCKRSHPKAMFRFLGAILGTLGSILGGLEAILGGLGRVLGGLGDALGAFWGHLGGSWAVLADLGTILGSSWAILG